MNTKTLILNLVTGEQYQIETDEINNIQDYELPLKKKIPTSCSRCWGRGWIGRETIGKQSRIVPCVKCINKCIDRPLIESIIKKTKERSNGPTVTLPDVIDPEVLPS